MSAEWQRTDPSALVEHARQLLEQGETQAALSSCDQALSIWPDIGQAYRLQLEIARACADRGRIVLALEALVRHDAEDADSRVALARELADTGALHRAAAVLRPLILQRDGGAHAGFYADLLLHVGAWDELHLLRAILPPEQRPPLPLALAALAAAEQRDRVLAEAGALAASPRWLDAEAALASLNTAITASTPFSMLRLDAAVALFLAATGRCASRTLEPAERMALLDNNWSGWFGSGAAESGDAVVAALRRELDEAIETADIVAMSAAHEIAADGPRFGALVEMHRQVRAGTDALFADSTIAVQMHRLVPYLRTVLAGLPFLGFVGAHPAMFRKLAHFCGVSETRFVPVPREAAFPVAEEGIDPRGFLADGHRATVDGFSVPFPGAVFLISAPGPLGAIYAGRIKALGGIAVEIGPLAAKWAGG